MLTGADLALPFWLLRQRDPTGASFLAGGGGDPPRNVTHRDWTTLGVLGGFERATVDPRGLVTPQPGGWSLDWWVRGEDRWYLPAGEPTVRQELVGDTPVVRTAMRCGRGDVVQHAYAVVGPGGTGWLVVDIANATPTAVAVALAVRPWGPTGPAPVHSVQVPGRVIVINGAAAVHLDRDPAEVVLAGSGDPDPVEVLMSASGPAGVEADDLCSSSNGTAAAAVVFALPHTLSLQVLMPLRASEHGLRAHRGTAMALPEDVPAAERVASGWQVQRSTGPRLELPDDQLSALVEANRAHLVLAHAGDELVRVPDTPLDWVEAASVLAASDGFGDTDAVAAVLGSWEERQAFDGHFLGDDDRREVVGAALCALGEHWHLHRDAELVESLVGPVAKAAHWISRRGHRRLQRRRADTTGLLAEGSVPSWLGAPGVTYDAAWWSIAGLRAAAGAMVAIDQPEVAEDAARSAAELDGSMQSCLAADADRLGHGCVPSGPGRDLDGGIVAIVDAVLLGVLDPSATSVEETLDAVVQHHLVDGAVYLANGAQGLSARLTARLARAELARGGSAALPALDWLVRRARPTGTWPEVTHPRTLGGAAGSGHDPVAAAEFLLLVRDLLVRWDRDTLALASLVPPSWLGQGWEVHDLPTPFGRFGYAVRWHGERPAVLWELEPHPGVAAPLLRAPGLDRAWTGEGLRGEALLAPVTPPEAPASEVSVSEGDDGAPAGLQIRSPRRSTSSDASPSETTGRRPGEPADG